MANGALFFFFDKKFQIIFIMLDYVPFGSAMFAPLSLVHTIVFKIVGHEPLGGVWSRGR